MTIIMYNIACKQVNSQRALSVWLPKGVNVAAENEDVLSHISAPRNYTTTIHPRL